MPRAGNKTLKIYFDNSYFATYLVFSSSDSQSNIYLTNINSTDSNRIESIFDMLLEIFLIAIGLYLLCCEAFSL